MKAVVVALAAAGLLAAGAAQAQSGAEVAKAKGCLNCHAVDQKKVGPAFKDVAAKFAGKGDAELVAKLKGGKGHPKINGTDAEIKAAVDYALSAK
jgi:cytochrome c